VVNPKARLLQLIGQTNKGLSRMYYMRRGDAKLIMHGKA